jgi:hypothetical protein
LKEADKYRENPQEKGETPYLFMVKKSLFNSLEQANKTSGRREMA